MPTFSSFNDFGNELQALGRDLETTEKRKITNEMGKRGQAIFARAAARDLGGDPKFSGWAPVLATKVRQLGDGSALLVPASRSAAGPITVAEQGRNQGNAGGFFGPGIGKSGSTARTKSGNVRKVRAFSAKRWNGVTQGKGTASDALGEMERELPKVAETGVRKAIRRRFD